MSLTLGSGPLAGHPGGPFNFEFDAPPHRIYFDDYPRRIRALIDGRVVLDSMRGKLLHETGILPRYYAPLEDFDQDLLEATDHSTHCPFKGDASYWSIRVGERVEENALWFYPDPIDASPWLEGYGSLSPEKADLWMQEDEPVRTHLRDPYHRVDVLESSRRVTVRANGELIAESDRPKLVFETSIAPRAYLLRSDVRAGVLTKSEKTAACGYKGEATYWHLRAGDETIEDAAWSYESPLPEALRVASHLSFEGEGVEVELD